MSITIRVEGNVHVGYYTELYFQRSQSYLWSNKCAIRHVRYETTHNMMVGQLDEQSIYRWLSAKLQ